METRWKTKTRKLVKHQNQNTEKIRYGKRNDDDEGNRKG